MIEFSVVVPVYHGVETLPRCLNALLHQSIDQSRYEIIVVDDGSRDQTAPVAESVIPPRGPALETVEKPICDSLPDVHPSRHCRHQRTYSHHLPKVVARTFNKKLGQFNADNYRTSSNTDLRTTRNLRIGLMGRSPSCKQDRS